MTRPRDLTNVSRFWCPQAPADGGKTVSMGLMMAVFRKITATRASRVAATALVGLGLAACRDRARDPSKGEAGPGLAPASVVGEAGGAPASARKAGAPTLAEAQRPPSPDEGPRLALGVRWDLRAGRTGEGEAPNEETLAQRTKALATSAPQTFFCGCPFQDHTVRVRDCGYRARVDEELSRQLIWTRVVPARAFGEHRPCWTGEGCQTRGAACCREKDPQFRSMEADLVNLVPEIAELAQDRGDYAFGDVEGEERLYGTCDFEVDRWRELAEPADALRGDVARIYLYMHHAYPGGLPLDDTERTVLMAWHRDDPPSDTERSRNQAIAQQQGVANPLVPASRAATGTATGATR